MLSASSLTGAAGGLTGAVGGLTGAAGGLTGAAGGLTGAANLTYQSLQDKYLDFGHPRATVQLGGETFASEGGDIIVGDLRVEITSGYEASVATFRLYDVFDPATGEFRYDKVSKQVVMGNSVTILMGYLSATETVFVGFISGVAFGYEKGDLPYIEVSAMDVKGLMMGGSYAQQLTATTYGAAVKEVLGRTGSGKIQQMGGITSIAVSSTPDETGGAAGGLSGAAGGLSGAAGGLSGAAGGLSGAAGGLSGAAGGLGGAAGGLGGAAGGLGGGAMGKSSPITVEMVGESDYEFVVRAAKRYNFEFFVDRGKVLFRPMKSDTSVLMTLGVRQGIQTFHIAYSLTSVVGEIEARAMDPGKGEVISANSKFNNTISTGSKAKQLMGSGTKVYLDASISSKEEAQARVDSLMEKMSYRLGSLEADCVGLPDLVPGRFIKLSGLGTPVDNQFYITTVVHNFSGDTGYSTHIEGCANQMQTGLGAGGLNNNLTSAGGNLLNSAGGNINNVTSGLGGLL